MKVKTLVLSLAFLAIIFLGIGCSGGDSKKTITVLSYDSFVIPDEVIDEFESTHNINLKIIHATDVGNILALLILNQDNPIADAVYGIDNTFLQRALDEEVFLPYNSPLLENVADEFKVNAYVTPVDYGDVCLNYWRDEFAPGQEPKSLDDLRNPQYRNLFVTQNPETSSPGLAFLLSTIARYGEDGWEQYWQDLRANGIKITSGWSESYYGDFVAGGGRRSIVTSYASSPVAEVVYADPMPDQSPTGVILDSCFRQVEYAGIVAGTNQIDSAQKTIDFFLSKAFQEIIPLNLFVHPVNQLAELPEAFVKHSPVIENPHKLPTDLVAEKRDEWTKRWVEIVLR